MSNQGPITQSPAAALSATSVQAFRARPATTKTPLAVPVRLALQAIGGGMVVVAGITAVAPIESVTKVATMFDRLGLDKGPMAAFGITLFALGFVLESADRARQAATRADDAATHASNGLVEIEGQGAILAGVQGELGAMRAEVAEFRGESRDAREKTSGPSGQAQDPIFRLAASLDQLGAQIDKRVDRARTQMLDSVNSLAKSIEVGADQTEQATSSTKAELDAVRMDVADMRGQLTRVLAEISETRDVVTTALDAQKEASTALQLAAKSGAPAAPMMVSPIETPSMPTPTMEHAPLPSPAQEPSAEAHPHATEPQLPRELTGEPIQMAMPEPPAPIPSRPEEPSVAQGPSEGLDLIDDMEEDTARMSDMTPPLFPDMDA